LFRIAQNTLVSGASNSLSKLKNAHSDEMNQKLIKLEKNQLSWGTLEKIEITKISYFTYFFRS
jgi:hypothetical protein